MRTFLRSLVKRKIALAGAAVLVLILVLALFSPLIATHDPMGLNPAERLQGPGAAHWFGTDELGRDLFARTIHGARVSLSIGIAVALLSLGAGALLGGVAGYAGGAFDWMLARATERRQELAIRAALGASRARLTRHSSRRRLF